MIEDVVRKGRLLDMYGPLLTPRQYRCMDMYYNLDLSLSEIGEELNISRQGAYDMLSRASKALETYESRLGFLSRNAAVRAQIREAQQLLVSGRSDDLIKIREILRNIEYKL